MSSAELNRLKWQRPFQPFRVTTVNNETFDVMDPGLILIASQNVNIGLPHPDRPLPAVRDVIWLGTEDIVGVEMLAEASR